MKIHLSLSFEVDSKSVLVKKVWVNSLLWTVVVQKDLSDIPLVQNAFNWSINPLKLNVQMFFYFVYYLSIYGLMHMYVCTFRKEQSTPQCIGCGCLYPYLTVVPTVVASKNITTTEKV